MKLIFRYLYALMLFVCFTTNSSGQSIQEKEDSLLSLIENTVIDTVKAKHYISLGAMYVYSEPNKASEFFHKGLVISTKTQFYYGLGKCYAALFNVHYVLGSDSDSLLVYVKSRKALYEKTGDINDKVEGQWYHGVYHRSLGNNDKAIKEYLKALELVQQHNLPKVIEAKLLGNIGAVLDVNGDYEEALHYYKKAAPLFVNNKKDEAIAYFNIGQIYSNNLNKADTALQFFSKAYVLAEEVEQYSLVVRILVEQGCSHDIKGNYKKANERYQSALKVHTEQKLGENFASIFTAFSTHHLKRKQYRRSIEYSEKAIKIVEKTKKYILLAKLYENQEAAYAALGNYKNAYEVKTKLTNHLDSLNSVEVKGNIKELQTKYEVEQKEVENKLLKEKREADLRKIKYRNYAGLGLIFALSFSIGWIITYYNSNQKLQVNKELIERQSDELKELYEHKNRFFVNIAHELRTPLMLIANPISNVIKNSSLSNNNAQNLNIAHRNVTYLKQLTNQILDLSKNETKELPVQIHQFQLSDILNTLIADFQPLSDYQKINFQQPIQIDTILLKTDGEKLFIILKNLLSNAFKYTVSGEQVSLRYVNNDEMLAISVQDTGRGISTADIQHIFNPYFQSKNAPIEGGTGIGLAICKTYIQQLDGTIQVDSKLGQGSTFTIQFPKQLNSSKGEISNHPLSFLEQNQLKTDNQSLSAPQNEDKPRLLVVEDNLDICKYLESILELQYQIVFAHNGVEGLKQLEQQTPDLILTDLMMPVMDGFEFMKKVKQNEKWQQIPIIALTARSEMADKLAVLRIGVDDYLVKPFHEEELQIRVKNLLKNQSNRLVFIAEETEKAEAASFQSDVPTDNTPTITQNDQEWLKNLENLTYSGIPNVDFKAQQLSLELDISYSQLYRKTKLLTGFTPKQYINQIRYQQARQFLESKTYVSVKRVAYEVGFKDPKNFSRNFKKRFGKYPSAYMLNS